MTLHYATRMNDEAHGHAQVHGHPLGLDSIIHAHIPRHDGTNEAAGHTDQHGAAPRRPTPADSTTSPEALRLEQRVSQQPAPSGQVQRLARSASRAERF